MIVSQEVVAFVSGLGFAGGGVALYVKLSLPEYTLRVLNGRYPTTDLINTKFDAVDSRINALKDLIEARLDTILCSDCPHCGKERGNNVQERSEGS